MTTKQLIDFYKGKRDMLCPLTEELIKTGYQQERGGYIMPTEQTQIFS